MSRIDWQPDCEIYKIGESFSNSRPRKEEIIERREQVEYNI